MDMCVNILAYDNSTYSNQSTAFYYSPSCLVKATGVKLTEKIIKFTKQVIS